MRLRVVLTIVACLLALPGAGRATGTGPPLGRAHFGLQLDYVIMQHRSFEADDLGVRLGVEGYGHLGSHWYLGGEVGYGTGGFLFGPSSSLATMELNVKRALSVTRHLVLGAGGGLSYSLVEVDDSVWLWDEPEIEVRDWVLGIQMLADLRLRLDWALLGVNVKYMLTQDVEGFAEIDPDDPGWDMSGLLFGFQVGFAISEWGAD